VALAALVRVADAQMTRFADPHPEGGVIEYWRLTHDPVARDHGNYHNTNCWSPDGRYVCYTHWANGASKAAAEVWVHDLQADRAILTGKGLSPRWAKQHNWLIYTHYDPEGGDPWEKGTQILRRDMSAGTTDLITHGMEFLGSTDSEDRWIYGNQRLRYLPGKQWHTARARLQPNSPLEVIYENKRARRPLCNPQHPVISERAKQERPFGSSRVWLDLDGSNVRIGAAMMQSGHMAWSGDGEYQLVGNYQARGRRWDEPFPSDMHLLANTGFGDISPCGRSGRWICGDYAVADLRSGDGRGLPRPPSVMCFPEGTGDASDSYDADPKGSPDGTKICFVSNYDFQNQPFAQILETVTDEDSLPVTSTRGFPASGDINVLGEVVGYTSRTPTSFEGLERHKYGSGGYPFLKKNWYATLFSALRLTPDERKRASRPWDWLIDGVGGDMDHPLLWQRQTDMYVSVIRRPDPPHLRMADGGVQLIPGENHWETFGYFVDCDGERIDETPVRPGARLQLTKAGTYHAVAVEWSGLEGKQSLPLRLNGPASLTVFAEEPQDFSWTRRVWVIGDREVAEATARDAAQATCETRHLYDGVIRRERYENGVMVAAGDLNADGYPTRRLTHVGGKLATREYWRPNGKRVSREMFAADGSKTEEIRWDIRYDPPPESDHWFYDHGVPVKRIVKNGREVYEKRGDEWAKTK
jgi:hypothetical protein